MSTSETASSMSHSAAEAVKARAAEVAHTTADTIASHSYLYPPLGALYLLRHPKLWPPLLKRLPSCLLLSAAVIIPMFAITYVPQAAVLSFVDGPLGPFTAIMLVLSESSTIINFLARSFVLQHALWDTFDATLVCEGQEALVAKGRELKPGRKSDGVEKLGKMIIKPLQKGSPAAIVEYFVLLPFNFIPVIGTAVFLVLQGRKIGPSYHARYFQLKGFTDSQREDFIANRKGAYVAFGTMSMVMNLIPFASILFTFTSTVGAALWAAEIESKASFPGETVDVSGKEAHKDGQKKEF